MGIKLFQTGKPTALAEEVLYEVSRFRLVSSATFPSYKVGWNMGAVWNVRLLVTGKRCRVLTTFLWGAFYQEIDMWYPGANADDPETLQAVESYDGLIGPCLMFSTHNPTRTFRLIWSPDLRLRFYFTEADMVAGIIQEAMGKAAEA